jgi:hypothetical protein
VSITGEPVKVPASKHGKVKPYGSVKLFLSKEEVKQPYEVIDQLAVGGNVSDEGKFIRAFEYHAADLGGDGVIFYRGTPMGQDNSYRGEVIRFK